MGNLLDQLFGNPDLKCAMGLAATPLVGPAAGLLACREAVESRLAPPTRACEASLSPEACEMGRKLGLVPEKTYRTLQRLPISIPSLRCRVEKSFRDLALSALGLSGLPIAVGLERFGYPASCSKDASRSLEDIGRQAAEIAFSAAAMGLSGIGARALGQAARQISRAAPENPTLKEAVRALGGPGALIFFSPLF